MTQIKVTRDNLVQVVDSALKRCRFELEQTIHEPANSILVQDLRIAQKALELIYTETHGGPQRPKSQRSAMFTRYVIDEEPQMVMDHEFRDLIVQIEDVYSRY